MVTSIVRPLLKDRNKEIVFRAVEVLAKIGPGAESAVPDLIVLLNSDSSDNNWVIRALGAIGPAASSSVPAIEDAVERTRYPDRQQMEITARTAIKSINRLSHKYSPLLAK
ncbi:MAG: HEAT repeat domain-containing protein [Cyanobacteria bacterium HKST-UBA02]|nr:HEAT repeat domain-containing protein [Cyanobacteria bacterium HKST-UBA02]